MKENRPNSFEERSEHIPTPEEILGILKAVIRGEFTEVGRYEDEKGVYRLDVHVPGEAEGEIDEYIYTRSGRYPQSQSAETDISVVHYQDGVALTGTAVAKFVDGNWQIV